MSEAISTPTTPPTSPAMPDRPAQLHGASTGTVRPQPHHFLDSVVRPDAYGCLLRGDCLAPEINNGDMALVSPSELPQAGDLVVLYSKNGGTPWLKRLVMAPMVPVGTALHPSSDVALLVIVEMLNPPHRFRVPTDQLAAMHRVIGVIPKDAVAVACAATRGRRHPAGPVRVHGRPAAAVRHGSRSCQGGRTGRRTAGPV